MHLPMLPSLPLASQVYSPTRKIFYEVGVSYMTKDIQLDPSQGSMQSSQQLHSHSLATIGVKVWR